MSSEENTFVNMWPARKERPGVRCTRCGSKVDVVGLCLNVSWDMSTGAWNIPRIPLCAECLREGLDALS